MNQKRQSHLLPIIIMFALFFMIAFVTGLQNPFAVIVKDQFSASNFLSQLGNAANFIAYAFMGIPAGMLLQRIGYKRTALAAVTVGFVGVLITFLSGQAGSFVVYLVGAFISGFSMCMLNTVVNPMLNSLGKNERQGNQLIQFGGCCNSIGATLAPIIVGYLMGSSETARTIASANPALFLAMGIFVLAFVVLSLSKIPEPYVFKKPEGVQVKDKYSALSFRHFILGITAIFVYMGIELAVPNIGNLYMTQQLGIETSVAGTVVGTYWIMMFIGRLIGGVVGGKMSSKVMLASAAGLGLLFIVAALISFGHKDITISFPVVTSSLSFAMMELPIALMFMVLVGLSTSVMWGATFNLATSGLGKYTSMASGMFMVMVCGGGLLMLLQGWLSDMFTIETSFWLVVAELAFILYYALWGSKNINKNIPVE